MLSLLDEAAGKIPCALERRPRQTDEKDAAGVVGDESGGSRGRVRIGDEAAYLARCTPRVRFDCGSAARAEPPVRNHEEGTMHDQPAPSEREQEEAHEGRQQEEESMRYPEHDDPAEQTRRAHEEGDD